MKFADYFIKRFEMYKENKVGLAAKNRYLQYYTILKEHPVGQMEMNKITREHAQKLMNDYGANRMKNTVYGFKNAVKPTFADAVIDGYAKKNPFEHIQVVYKEQRMSQIELRELREKKKSLSIDEYNRMKNFLVHYLKNVLLREPFVSLKTGFKNTHSRYMYYQIRVMIIYMGLKTGARYSEVLGLTTKDINFEDKSISINKSWDYKIMRDFAKTKNIASVREIYLDDEAMELLSMYLLFLEKNNIELEREAIFIQKHLNVFNTTINNALEDVCVTCGIEPITYHKLRHTQASYLIAMGVPLMVIAKRLGHTDTNMIQRTYGHLLAETEESANKKIIELI